MSTPLNPPGDSQTVVLGIGEGGRVQELLRIRDRAIQVLTDQRGVLHVFGVSGYDPAGMTESRVELWHRSYDGNAWSARESLLHASLINWPSSGRVAIAGQKNLLHLVVPFADSAGTMGMLYLRGNTGRWTSTIPSKTLAAFATVAELPDRRIVIAYLHGSQRAGGVNNVNAIVVDTLGDVSPPALIHKTGNEPALTVFLIPMGDGNLNVVFSQRTSDGATAIKQSGSLDGGRTWAAAHTRVTVRNLIQVNAGSTGCAEPSIFASYANDARVPELGVIRQTDISPVEIGGTLLDYGLGLGQRGEVLLISSEAGPAGFQWTIRRWK